MTPFDFLGLPEDADERTVKRAYAQRLKRVRPDEDAHGFQQLHEAYQAALAQCSARVAVTPDAVVRTAAAMSGPIPRHATSTDGDASAARQAAQMAAPPISLRLHRPGNEATSGRHGCVDERLPALDLPRLIRESSVLACTASPEQVLEYLQQQPTLWSLQAKATAARRVIGTLSEQAPPFPADTFDLLIDFFNQSQIASGHDTVALMSLRKCLHLRWELLASDAQDYAERHRRIAPKDPPPQFTPGTLRLLTRPFSFARMLASSLLPGLPSRVFQFIQALDGGRIDRLPPELNRDALRFWLRAADASQSSLPWFAMRSLRILFLAALLAIALYANRHNHPEATDLLTFSLVGCGLYGALLLWRLLHLWLIQPQQPNERLWSPRSLILPMSSVLVFALGYARHTAWMLALLWFFLFLAITRYRFRCGLGPLHIRRWSISTLLACSLVAAMITAAAAAFPGAFGSVAILAVWCADLWKQRKLICAA